ncbi:hypothetical protein [Nocardia crassostreae]|uniref:hypothetical protein n=1 Tax=Nocardia crassostreae TaxID=53428 RepID=UPI0008318FF0|nr:hypothetical protein [Nocardia crassostreae]
MPIADRGVLVGDDLFEEFPGLGCEGGRELQCAVVLDDCLLDRIDRQVREVAESHFASAAFEVRVPAAGATGGHAVDES